LDIVTFLRRNSIERAPRREAAHTALNQAAAETAILRLEQVRYQGVRAVHVVHDSREFQQLLARYRVYLNRITHVHGGFGEQGSAAAIRLVGALTLL